MLRGYLLPWLMTDGALQPSWNFGSRWCAWIEPGACHGADSIAQSLITRRPALPVMGSDRMRSPLSGHHKKHCRAIGRAKMDNCAGTRHSHQLRHAGIHCITPRLAEPDHLIMSGSFVGALSSL